MARLRLRVRPRRRLADPPRYGSCRFWLLIGHVDVPSIRLHDLHHGAASLAHEAGADLKTLQDLFAQSSVVVTADTYASVLPVVQRSCANATAKLVLAAAHRAATRSAPTPL